MRNVSTGAGQDNGKNVESVTNWLLQRIIPLTHNRARACPVRLPAILGSSHGNPHRIASDREARFQARSGFFKESTHQIACPVSKNVPRIDATTGRILGARSEGTGLAKAVGKSAGVESAFREMVRRRATQSFGELSRSSS